jgi:hypothetical protein
MVMILHRIDINVYQRNSIIEVYRLTYYKLSYVSNGIRDSAVGIATGYGMDGRGIEVRVPVGSKEFSLLHVVQNGSGAHSTSYSMGTAGKAVGT